MTFLYKVNKMVKDKRKRGAFGKLKVISTKTMKRVSQMTINQGSNCKNFNEIREENSTLERIDFLGKLSRFHWAETLVFCGISFHVTSLLKTFNSFPGDLG